MPPSKKRQSLAEFQVLDTEEPEGQGIEETAAPSPATSPGRPAEPKKLHVSAYLPPKVREQLDLLSINERKPTGARKPLNDFILEGLDLLFAKRGLPSVDELSEESF